MKIVMLVSTLGLYVGEVKPIFAETDESFAVWGRTFKVTIDKSEEGKMFQYLEEPIQKNEDGAKNV